MEAYCTRCAIEVLFVVTVVIRIITSISAKYFLTKVTSRIWTFLHTTSISSQHPKIAQWVCCNWAHQTMGGQNTANSRDQWTLLSSCLCCGYTSVVGCLQSWTFVGRFTKSCKLAVKEVAISSNPAKSHPALIGFSLDFFFSSRAVDIFLLSKEKVSNYKTLSTKSSFVFVIVYFFPLCTIWYMALH